MKNIAIIISVVSLGLTLLPSFFVYSGEITLETSKNLMLAGTIGWFISASFWINPKKDKQESEPAETEI